MRWLLLVLVIAAFSGCVEDDRAMYRVSGSFTEDRANEDIDRLRALAERHGGQVAILESFPEQFVITRLDAAACQSLVPSLDNWDFIASHTGCVEEALQP